MTEPESGRGREPLRSPLPDWLAREIEVKIATGAGPDYEGAEEALRQLDASIAEHGPMDLGDEDVDDIIDGMGLRKNILRDWPVVPWTYWEARGAGPYRR
jgi:hypothetical protein